ncbi:solute carrier family 28 member 3-like [Ixodes scapularis]|uniref:solute carrier family 28 member 3-like n=1 Tax=Ixodes scapularis TaxID=6945 RepID=UPI001A9DC41B|nr:solute carrier family 28 member 3-like [Ixodes scapularis]
MSRIKGKRSSEESLASGSSIEETRSVMSFILSRVPGTELSAPPPPPPPPPPPESPVAVRKRAFPWTWLLTHAPCALRLLLLVAAHAAVAVSLATSGRDPREPWCSGSGLLLVFLGLLDAAIACAVTRTPRRKLAELVKHVNRRLAPITATKRFSRVSWTLILASILAFVAVDSRLHAARLASVFGIVMMLGFGYIFSAHRSKVRWSPVFWGVVAQFLLGLALVRWGWGRQAMACLGAKLSALVAFANAGSSFAFGPLVSGGAPTENAAPTVFSVLSTLIFFGMLVSVLRHYQVLQGVIGKLGWLMAATIGTTGCESFCAASNLLLGQADACMLIKPYMLRLTKSEIHCIMATGFATVSGSLLAIFIQFGLKPEYLLAASLMSAPAAMGFAKLFYPETEESDEKDDPLHSPDRNVLEAMAHGMSSMVLLAANMLACLMALVAGMALLDSALVYLGTLLGWSFLGLNWLAGRLFIPLTLAMGVDVGECVRVATLLGVRATHNELVAHARLEALEGQLPLRADLVSSYALCGFSNLGAVGVQLGAYAALAPSRLGDCAQVAPRALVAGSVACFMTACVTGALTDTSAYEVPTRFNSFDFI